nr:hypothetical protein [Neobacillus sp. Marseille-Q6967]
MKISQKMIIVLFAALVLAGLSGCSEEKAGTSLAPVEEKAKASSDDPQEQEKAVQEFVLDNTKIVKIFNVSKRINEKHPNLGPFFVIRGIDERGQKSEIWIQDMKIFEMASSN